MAGERRPGSSGTTGSWHSGPGPGSRRRRSLSCTRSSLEKALVEEYRNRITSRSPNTPETHLPRRYSSPYATKNSKSKGRKGAWVSSTPDPSARGLIGRMEEGGDKGPCVSQPDAEPLCQVRQGRRAKSAPAIRCTRNSPSEVPSFMRHSHPIRVVAYKNGSRKISAKITAPSMTVLLDECTSKLRLTAAARRVFLADGTEVSRDGEVPGGTDVYVSTGEGFVDPQGEVRAHLSLSKEARWTVGGVALPADRERARTRVSLSRRLRGLSQATPTVRVLAFRNGDGTEGCEISAAMEPMEEFLDLCTEKLHLTSPAKLLYDWRGERVEVLGQVPLLDGCLQCSISPLRGPVWVSRGEWFSPAGAKVYIQGSLGALRTSLQQAGDYLKQVKSALKNNPEDVTKKEVLSLTAEQLHDALGKAQERVAELRAAVGQRRDGLRALAPLLRAEEEQPGGYVSRHVQPLAQSLVLPQALHLKVYANGQSSGEMTVLVSMAELEKGCEMDPRRMMERLLQIVHQKMQSRTGHRPLGPQLAPTCLFDERGAVVHHPALLRNDQKVWVSYGEEYRPPLTPVLCLALTRVVAQEDVDGTAVFRAPVDPEMVLPAGSRKWEACDGFPSSGLSSLPGSCSLQDTVGQDAHFLQLKTDPQMVLFPSAAVLNQSSCARPNQRGRQMEGSELAWPLSHVWIITKSGSILSRTLPQLCLAASPQPVNLRCADGKLTEAYTLNVQKRVKGCPLQEWGFGIEGSIYSKAHSQFVLTYLEDPAWSDGVTADQQAERQGADGPEVSGCSIGDTNQNKVVGPCDTARRAPNGQRGKTQLTVALLRKHKDKQPQASAQRWAVRHEGIRKAGQWKQSKVENPLWNKLTYMWPVLPDGQHNKELKWPLEGALVPCAPPLTDTTSRAQDQAPLRLRVLRNGQRGGRTQAVPVMAPDATKGRRKTNPESSNQEQGLRLCDALEDDSSINGDHTQFQHFLERCTEVLKLPFAARRLFDKYGREVSLLRALRRDELVYVSCGEQWVDPQLCQAEEDQRLLLCALEWDVSLVRQYCAMRHQQDLVLDVVGELKEGSHLVVAERCPTPHGSREETVEQEHRVTSDGEASSDATTDPVPQQRQGQVPAAHRQEFEFFQGQIVSWDRSLVLGVASEGVRAGAAVQLRPRDPSDPCQLWVHRPEQRTLHLQANFSLVLGVSMPKLTARRPGLPLPLSGCPVILQTYKPYSQGAANQKWGCQPGRAALRALHSSRLDQEVTLATHASLCTACITDEPLHQQGFYCSRAGRAEKMPVCIACARVVRGRQPLQKLPPDSTFRCSSAYQDGTQGPTGTFKNLTVCQTDLSVSAAGETLSHLEECLDALRRRAFPQAPALETSTARVHPAIKILARRNGRGLEGGHLITAATMPLLLSQCTLRLRLPRAASCLYTADGTRVLTLPQLKAWAVSWYLQEQEHHTSATWSPECSEADCEGQRDATSAGITEPSSEKPTQLTAEDLEKVDEVLLTEALRGPIDIWVSCGEPFVAIHVVHEEKKKRALDWQQKEKLLADLVLKRHKMRQLQGRRITKKIPGSMVPTSSPSQPVVVQGGWTEQTKEEAVLMEDVRKAEAHLARVEAAQVKKRTPSLGKSSEGLRNLYNQPDVKRVLVHRNGYPEREVYVWGQSIKELLNDSTSRLRLAQPATRLFTPDGTPLHTWAGVKRDSRVCVSSGERFMSAEDCRRKTQMRASYARINKGQDPGEGRASTAADTWPV